MAEDRKQQSLDISITGSVDSSLAKAIGVTEAQLAKLKDAVNTINKGFSAEAFKPAAQGMKDAEAAASSFHGTMQRIGETMAGVFSAEMATKFFDAAIEGAKKLGEFMKDAGIQAASMEILRKELRIEMGKGGAEASEADVNKWLNKLQFFSDNTVIRLKDAAEAFRGALTIPGMDPDKAFKVIERLTDVAASTTPTGMAPSEHFRELQETYFQAMRGGNLMEKTIRPLEREGISIRPYLEGRLGISTGLLGATGTEMSPEQVKAVEEGLSKVYKDIKKGEVPAQFLEDFFKDITSQGGKYFDKSKEFGTTATGGWSTLMDKFENIVRGIGSIELGPFEAIVNKINSSFTSEAFAKIQNFFEDAAAKSKAWIDEIMKAWDKVDTSKLIKSFQELGNTLAKAFGAGATIDQWQKTLQALVDSLTSLVKLTASVVSAIESINKAIGALDAFVEAHKLTATLTPEQKSAVEAKAAAGGHADAAPNRSNYLNDADYQKAVARFNSSPHMAAGGIVTRATSLIAGESGPEAILPLAVLRDHPLVQVTKDETEQMAKLTDAMFRMTDTMATMQTTMSLGGGAAGGGGPPGFSGMSGGVYYTEYGPSVKGDQPGGPTYDSNSYNRIGAWPGVTGKLQPGDVALGHGAEAFYHVRPGQTFVDTRGNTVRFADRSGSKNPMNEDVFRLAAGGIVRRPTNALVGESGPEAVIPLNGGGLVNLHYSPTIHGFGDVAGLLREHADELLKQVEHALSSRFASMANV